MTITEKDIQALSKVADMLEAWADGERILAMHKFDSESEHNVNCMKNLLSQSEPIRQVIRNCESRRSL